MQVFYSHCLEILKHRANTFDEVNPKFGVEIDIRDFKKVNARYISLSYLRGEIAKNAVLRLYCLIYLISHAFP